MTMPLTLTEHVWRKKILFLMAVEYVSKFKTDYFRHAMGAKMESNMRNDLFQHVQKLSFQYHDNTRTGQLMPRISVSLYGTASFPEPHPKRREIRDQDD
ncbi:ABC transporter transmembrane domain-containing protein [Paenibacillus sp. GCM10027628]|uniref:ABC transporter transmembrane domain-containing protein n=1 Tax=Paenibacillus sp. GCM10027628 TaxID=3273413 RepID=UPI00362EEE83